ncbi:acyltransferase [Xenorhabdus bovienii]|uniref:acyltransferase family protein n=1 Tax=Xenorhabdus bovienii TaxID=40576 RepID=UPI0023B23B00|nr:acyltransferase [Xenorhabdus bovienii]MDE9446813.1 acyltransferase [Xenorhabdus bovienii]
MKSANSSYISRLDHIRFFAAFLVVYVHTYAASGGLNYTGERNILERFMLSGNTGVTLFLVLSGFIFTIITDAGNKNIDYRIFVFNRIKRVFPLMVFVCIISMSMYRETTTFNDMLSLFFFSNLQTSPIFKSFGQTWTIAVETQFYLILPFLLGFMRKRGVNYILMLSIFWVAIRIIIVMTYKGTLGESQGVNAYYYLTMIGRFDQLLVGMVFGWLYVNHKEIFSRKIFLIGALIISFFGITFITESGMWATFHPLQLSLSYLEAIIWGVLIISYASCNIHIPMILDRSLSWLGEISYSQYILHILILDLFTTNIGFLKITQNISLNATLNVFIIYPIIIVFSKASFELIEKPFLEMRKKYTK